VSTYIFERIPNGWHIEVAGESCLAKELVGFLYIDVLLRHPGQRLPNVQVLALVGGSPAPNPYSDHLSIHGQRGPNDEELTQHFTLGAEWDDDEGPTRDESLGYQHIWRQSGQSVFSNTLSGRLWILFPRSTRALARPSC
jgi:hypothetical protein